MTKTVNLETFSEVQKDGYWHFGIREKKPTITELVPLLKEYYSKPENCVGGSLHIVLEDDNLENGHIEYCIEYAKKEGDLEGAKLGEMLLQLTKSQRRRLVTKYYGVFSN